MPPLFSPCQQFVAACRQPSMHKHKKVMGMQRAVKWKVEHGSIPSTLKSCTGWDVWYLPCIPCRDVRENSSHVTCDAEFLWFMIFSESGYFPLAMWPSSSLKGDRTSSWKYLQYLQCLKFLWHPILNEMLYEVKGSFHLVHAKLQRWLSNKAHELKNGQIEGDHCNRLHSERFHIILILSRIVRSVLLKVEKRGFQTFPPQVSKETGGISGSLFLDTTTRAKKDQIASPDPQRCLHIPPTFHVSAIRRMERRTF